MKKTKNMFRAVALALVVIMLATALSACAKGNKFVYDGDYFKDKKTDVKYIDAPSCYEPVSIGEKIYGHSEDAKFYQISDKDPLRWICEEGGTVFYAEGETLPALDEMNVLYAEICVDTNTEAVRRTIHDKEEISEAMAGYLEGESITYTGIPTKSIYKIKFADVSLGLFYTLTYIRYESEYTLIGDDGEEVGYGKDFLYNRFEGRFVKAPRVLIDYVNEIEA